MLNQSTTRLDFTNESYDSSNGYTRTERHRKERGRDTEEERGVSDEEKVAVT